MASRMDLVTDQTSAHDALNGYIPAGMTLDEAAELRQRDPKEYERRSLESMAEHVRAMLDFDEMGAVVFDYGNNLRGQALRAGVEDALHFPGFVPAFIRPLFCRGKGPFRWVALSGDPEDIYRTDEEILRLFPEDEALARWMRMARERIHFQGLPARICWLGYGERDKAGLAFNELVRRGEVKGAHRHRARPPRLRLGRLALSRDRGHARRLRRHRRLAHPQRAAEHGERRLVGLVSITAAASASATRCMRAS